MQRFRDFNATQWVAVASGVVGALSALASILLGNPIAALATAVFVGGFVYLMDRERNSDGPTRHT